MISYVHQMYGGASDDKSERVGWARSRYHESPILIRRTINGIGDIIFH
jgi:hypothetical protein